MINKKGFTLVELLAIIVILGTILAIAVPAVNGVINKMKLNAFIEDKRKMVEAAKSFIVTNNTYIPKNIGDTTEITLSDLQDNNEIKNIKNPNNKDAECNGYVTITKVGNSSYDYVPHLNCEEDIGNSTEDGLISHWKLDGNAYNYTVNNFTATISGATPTTNRFNQQNKAYNFDGDDYIEFAASPLLNITGQITIEAWIKPTRITGTHTVISRSLNTYNTTYWIDIRTGNTIYFGGYKDTAGTIAYKNYPYTFQINVWHHITCTYDSSNTISIYVNGVKIGSGTSVERISGSWPLRIGSRVSTNYFYGAIDDVRIYNRALSDTEIKQDYEIGKTESE